LSQIIYGSSFGNATVPLTFDGATNSTYANYSLPFRVGATIISLKVAGPSSTTGFFNLTIPRNWIFPIVKPLIYIDGKRVKDSGYAEDKDNVYIWFNTIFSTHAVLIEFISPSTSQTPLYVYAVIVAVVVVAIIAAGLYALRKRKPKST